MWIKTHAKGRPFYEWQNPSALIFITRSQVVWNCYVFDKNTRKGVLFCSSTTPADVSKKIRSQNWLKESLLSAFPPVLKSRQVRKTTRDVLPAALNLGFWSKITDKPILRPQDSTSLSSSSLVFLWRQSPFASDKLKFTKREDFEHPSFQISCPTCGCRRTEETGWGMLTNIDVDIIKLHGSVMHICRVCERKGRYAAFHTARKEQVASLTISS